MSFKNYGQSRKRHRKSFRGYLLHAAKNAAGQQALPMAAATAVSKSGTGGYTAPATTYVAKKFKPVSDEVTIYGAKKFRTPMRENEFTGTQGSPIVAGVLDIDGTMSGYGQGIIASTLKWIEKVEEEYPEIVWLVITARDHGSFGYVQSFNWVMRHFPRPFIGPFARPKDDPRYASEFKRELAQGFEDMGLYQIVAAADDNEFVIDMWKQWAKDHFEEPKDFMLLECSYGTYDNWRSGLPSKGYGPLTNTPTTTSSGSWGSPYGASGAKADEVWITGYWNDTEKRFVQGHYAKRWSKEAQEQKARDKAKKAEAKNRPAGQTTVSQWGTDPVDKVYKLRTEFKTPKGTPEVVTLDGEVVDEDDWTEGHILTRPEVEELVGHDYPTKTPEEIAAMSDVELWAAADLNYREELIKLIEHKFGQTYFAAAELAALSNKELGDVCKMYDPQEAGDYVDEVLRYLGEAIMNNVKVEPEDETAEPEEEESDDADKSEDRQFLESEVYANCPDRLLDEIADADDETLVRWLRCEGTNTGALDPAEVLAAATAGDYEPPPGVAELIDAIVSESVATTDQEGGSIDAIEVGQKKAELGQDR